MAIVYASIASIGNTGTPPDIWGHNACWPEGLARDSSNNIYEVRGFDEPHHDIARRSITTGAVLFTTDQVVNDFMLTGIAVEQDASWAYMVGFFPDYGSSPPRSKTCVYRINMAPGLDRFQRRSPFTTAGDHIETYSIGDIPTTGADQNPLHSISIAGNSLWVTDSYGNRLIKYDKVSGVQQQVITGIPGARGLAIDASGNLWVGCNNNQVRSYNAAGTLINTSTLSTGTSFIVALSCVGTTMAVAWRRDGIHTYTMASGQLTTKLSSYGQPFRPGDKDPDRVYELCGMVMLSDLSIVFSDRVGYYGRVQKIGAWVQLGLEFTASLCFAKERPDLWISSDRQAYTVNPDGTWTFAGNCQTESLITPTYMGHYQSTHQGIPKMLKLGANYFFYYPAGMSLGIYRVIDNVGRGPSLQFCSIIGSGQPSPTGEDVQQFWFDANKYTWLWVDPVGDGVVRAGDVTTIYKPGDPEITVWWYSDCYTVDLDGTVWAREAVHGWERIVKIPLDSLNGIGNPVYKLSSKTIIFDQTQAMALVATSARIEFQTAVRADGDVYALVKSYEPSWPQNSGAWMGGNVVVCFTPAGVAKWGKVLPFWAVGITPIDNNGGFLIGTNDAPNTNGSIFHYDKDGNQLQKMFPNSIYGDNITRWFGGLDSKMSLNCMRDPRDGKVKVFAPDNIAQRILLYSIDDSGGVSPPVAQEVILSWDAPTQAPFSYAIYKTSGGTSTKIGTSTTTVFRASVNAGDQLSVRSVSSSGVESSDSIKVTVSDPSQPPVNLRVRATA